MNFISSEEWGQMLSEVRTHGDEELARFIREFPFAIKEDWVAEELTKWGIEGKRDLFMIAFKRGKGETEETTSYWKCIERLMVKDSINELRAQGLTITEACKKVATNPLEVCGDYVSSATIKNMYYKKEKAVTVMRETRDEFVILSYPGVGRRQNGPDIYGKIEFKIPKK